MMSDPQVETTRTPPPPHQHEKGEDEECSQLEVDQLRGGPFSSSSSKNNEKSSSNAIAPVEEVRKLLSRRMLVGISDGRFFLGNFYCIDKQGNIILQDALEFRSLRRSSPFPIEQRGLGLILIPSACRTSCHIDCATIEDQLSTLSV